MTEKIIEIIKQGDLRLPAVLFYHYKDLKISLEELVILIYLLNHDATFDPKKMANDMQMSIPELLLQIDELSSTDLLELQVVTKGTTKEEVLSLDKLYKKLGYFITCEDIKVETPKTNIYDLFEQEFSRSLSPIEFELVNGWLEAGFAEEIIELALKEAVYNGASNLRYIDKVLYEWKKKGIDSKEAYEKDREAFQRKKQEVKPKRELIDYDWLNDSDE